MCLNSVQRFNYWYWTRLARKMVAPKERVWVLTAFAMIVWVVRYNKCNVQFRILRAKVTDRVTPECQHTECADDIQQALLSPSEIAFCSLSTVYRHLGTY